MHRELAMFCNTQRKHFLLFFLCDGEITRDEFIENGLKSGFVMNLMEYFEDVPDPEPEKCGKPRCRNKCRCEPSDGD